jgi:hypothetical protein
MRKVGSGFASRRFIALNGRPMLRMDTPVAALLAGMHHTGQPACSRHFTILPPDGSTARSGPGEQPLTAVPIASYLSIHFSAHARTEANHEKN